MSLHRSLHRLPASISGLMAANAPTHKMNAKLQRRNLARCRDLRLVIVMLLSGNRCSHDRHHVELPFSCAAGPGMSDKFWRRYASGYSHGALNESSRTAATTGSLPTAFCLLPSVLRNLRNLWIVYSLIVNLMSSPLSDNFRSSLLKASTCQR